MPISSIAAAVVFTVICFFATYVNFELGRFFAALAWSIPMLLGIGLTYSFVKEWKSER